MVLPHDLELSLDAPKSNGIGFQPVFISHYRAILYSRPDIVYKAQSLPKRNRVFVRQIYNLRLANIKRMLEGRA
jgi:hypothetical protein